MSGGLDQFSRITGIPIVFDPNLPADRVYMLNNNTIFYGTWVERSYTPVIESIKFQRRRRK
jgi:hypothetical protein